MTRPMRPDDEVAPSLRRSRAPWLTLAGLLVMIVAIVGAFEALDRQQDETRRRLTVEQQILERRRETADNNRALTEAILTEVQRRQAAHDRALCQLMEDLSTRAGPATLDALQEAMVELGCAHLPPAPTPQPAPPAMVPPTPAAAGPSGEAPANTRAPAPPAAAVPAAQPTTAAPTQGPTPTPTGVLADLHDALRDLIGG